MFTTPPLSPDTGPVTALAAGAHIPMTPAAAAATAKARLFPDIPFLPSHSFEADLVHMRLTWWNPLFVWFP
jgi:hypothetical protein